MIKTLHIFVALLLVGLLGLGQAWAQSRTAIVRGTISGQHGALDGATIQVIGSRVATYSDAQGHYQLSLPEGKHTLVVRYLGYQEQRVVIVCDGSSQVHRNLRLHPAEGKVLDEVEVVGRTPVQQVARTSYNVVAIDAVALRNVNLDIAGALNRISGVRIRENGGVGSESQINLNGFTGRHVRVFVDGIPLEGSGNSMRIANMPVGMAERIEVYKGVVPVELGSDALGGAINIVTGKYRRGLSGDASYSFGSFGTHRSSLNMGYANPNGLFANINAYQNYSKNNYKVLTEYRILETGMQSGEQRWFERFNDRYHNEAVIATLGVQDKSWADRLALALTYSQQEAQVQHANIMELVFGQKHRRGHNISPQLSYRVRDILGAKGLNLSTTAKYDLSRTHNIDTAARTYSWTGAYKPKATQGEGGGSMARFTAHSLYGLLNLQWSPSPKHQLTLNELYSYYTRKNDDSYANHISSTAANFMKRVNQKNVLGLSYKYTYNKAWNILAFAKHYYTFVIGPVNVTGRPNAYTEATRSSSALGYGMATSYLVGQGWQVKLSGEKTYRLPTERELFGDGDLERGEASVRPESSYNANLNASYTGAIAQGHNLYLEAGLLYRYTQDYIIRKVTAGTKGTASSSNHGIVEGYGAELTMRYFWQNRLNIGGNITYQSLRNKERYDIIGAESITYNDRVPNQPYFFAGLEASYHFPELMGKGTKLNVGYDMRYVHRFYNSWRSEGAKLYIPEQLSHDASITASWAKGKYNVTLEARNITDELLYDNYSLQKPGRSFSAKLRYTF